MATEDEAGTNRANVAGFLVSRDLVDGCKPATIDEFPSAPHKPAKCHTNDQEKMRYMKDNEHKGHQEGKRDAEEEQPQQK